MRDLRRNQIRIWYANFSGIVPILDGDGDETGEHEFSYAEPASLKATVSPNKGKSTAAQFGEFSDYDKVITFVGKSPIRETDVLWIDNLVGGEIPVAENGLQILSDYIVTKVAESLNSTSLAVKKVAGR